MDQKLLDSLGVVDWGYTEESKPLSFEHYKKWVQSSQHGPLNYLADHRLNLRSDIKNVYPEFQSALVFLFSYRPAKKWMIENNHHEIAAYALGFEGDDYHYELKRRLELIGTTLDDIESVVTLDIQPVLERDLAVRAGLGWFGKNSMMINQKEGSYFIIGSLLLNKKLDLETKASDVDHCGHCNLCIEACPTDALDPETRTLNAKLCISTYTIELFKDAPAPIGMENSRGEIFGCDICQDVCPWNKKPLQKTLAALSLPEKFSFLKDWFYTSPKLELMKRLEDMSNRELKKILRGTALDRPGRVGWMKNLKAYFRSNRNDL